MNCFQCGWLCMTLKSGRLQHVLCWQVLAVYTTRLQVLYTLERSKLFWYIERFG